MRKIILLFAALLVAGCGEKSSSEGSESASEKPTSSNKSAETPADAAKSPVTESPSEKPRDAPNSLSDADVKGLEEEVQEEFGELLERILSGEKEEDALGALDSLIKITANEALLDLLKADLLYDDIDFSNAPRVEHASIPLEAYLKAAVKKHDEAFKDKGFGEIKSKLPAGILGKMLSVDGINIGADLSSVSNFLKSQGYHLPQNKSSFIQQEKSVDRPLFHIDGSSQDGGGSVRNCNWSSFNEASGKYHLY